MNQSCLKLHARFETFTFFSNKNKWKICTCNKVKQKSAFERITASQSTGKESRSGLKTVIPRLCYPQSGSKCGQLCTEDD